jgi:hypothetical protein
VNGEDVFEGTYVDNQKCGPGKLTRSNGEIFQGEYSEGKLNGLGKLINKHGDWWEGTFTNGQSTEPGKLYDGKTEETKEGVSQDDYWKLGMSR